MKEHNVIALYEALARIFEAKENVEIEVKIETK